MNVISEMFGVFPDAELLHPLSSTLHLAHMISQTNNRIGRAARFGRNQLSPEQYLALRLEHICTVPDNVSDQVSYLIGLPLARLFKEEVNLQRAIRLAPEDYGLTRYGVFAAW